MNTFELATEACYCSNKKSAVVPWFVNIFLVHKVVEMHQELLKKEEESQFSGAEKKYPAVYSMENSNHMRHRVDPLTGKRIELLWQNGFSSFKQEGLSNGARKIDSNSHERCNWTIHSKWNHESSLHQQEIENAIYAGQKPDGKKRFLEASHLKGEVKEEGQGGILSAILKTWINPVFGVPKERQLEAQVDLTFQSKQRKLKFGSKSFTFSKENLEKIEVIGQVDNKFIACNLTTCDEFKKKARLVLLIDQHAAHERVRLEQLQDEFLQGFKKSANGLSVECKDLIPSVNIALSVPSDCSLRKLKRAFEKIGIRYTVKSETTAEDQIYVEVAISAMPTIFVKTSEYRGKVIQKTILEEHSTKELFYDHIKRHQEIPSATSIIPPSINNVLCSYACHGAIRFGDPMTLAECISLIKSLAKCKLPFQCAHGRPSIAPLINLDISSF